jgi:hypothetical protein
MRALRLHLLLLVAVLVAACCIGTALVDYADEADDLHRL